MARTFSKTPTFRNPHDFYKVIQDKKGDICDSQLSQTELRSSEAEREQKNAVFKKTFYRNQPTRKMGSLEK